MEAAIRHGSCGPWLRPHLKPSHAPRLIKATPSGGGNRPNRFMPHNAQSSRVRSESAESASDHERHAKHRKLDGFRFDSVGGAGAILGGTRQHVDHPPPHTPPLPRAPNLPVVARRFAIQKRVVEQPHPALDRPTPNAGLPFSVRTYAAGPPAQNGMSSRDIR